jgi:hypothetical protein
MALRCINYFRLFDDNPNRGAQKLPRSFAAKDHSETARPCVAPLGAHFADDPERITEQASLSSIPTHCHPEAVAGAVAVAGGEAKSQSADRRAGPRKGNESATLDSIIKGISWQFPYWTVLDRFYTLFPHISRTSPPRRVPVSDARS